MVSALEVPEREFLTSVAEKLKQNEAIQQPKWAMHVKTGAHAERRPQQEDWWHMRCASLLRRIYKNPGVGVGKLKRWYGGAKRRGVRPQKHYDASGNIIRKCLQQLEKAEYIKKEKKGRALTPKGKSLLDKTALEVRKEIANIKKQKQAQKFVMVKETKEAKPAEIEEPQPAKKAPKKHKKPEKK